jgi:hypothetical protein
MDATEEYAKSNHKLSESSLLKVCGENRNHCQGLIVNYGRRRRPVDIRQWQLSH